MTLHQAMTSTPVAPDALYACDAVSFRAIATILRDAAGINLPEENSSLVVSRLVKHLRRLNLPSFAAYAAWITAPEHPEDRARMITALTMSTTHFWREGYHFDFFARGVVPRL